MTKISKNFKLSEFQCRDGSDMPPCVEENIRELVKTILQPLRDYVGVSITITSGYRSPAYNRRIGSRKTSQHVKGRAADFKIKGMTPKRVADFVQLYDPPGLGRYKTFTHVDIRKGRKARWGKN